MTIGADNCLGICLVWIVLLPAGDDFCGWNIVCGVTFPARLVNGICRVHSIRRSRVVLVVTVGV